MARVKRDQHFVWPDRYYIWTYFPPKYRKSTKNKTKKQLYQKHYTCIPFFTRRHAKHVVCFYHGVKALHSIHIIKGSRLIKQGITTFNQANGIKEYHKAAFIKQRDGTWYPGMLRQWVYPPEYRMDSHRRRHYIISLNKAFEKYGKVGFNRKYELLNMGNSYRRLARWFLRMRIRVNRSNIYTELDIQDMANEVAKLEVKGKPSIYPITISKCKCWAKGIISEEPFIINSKVDFDTLLEEVKQFNNDLGNQRKGIHIIIKNNV